MEENEEQEGIEDYHIKLARIRDDIDDFLKTEFDVEYPENTPIVRGWGQDGKLHEYKIPQQVWPGGAEYYVMGLIYDLENIKRDFNRKYEIKHNIRPKISSTLRKRILERDKYRCVNCHSFKDLAIDHIKAFSEGGTNDIGNLRTLCKKCNSAKRDRKTLTTF